MLFEPFLLKFMSIRNRVVLPPMCSYLATEEGMPTAFHLQHYLSRSIGGVGLVIQEATAIEPNGRITNRDLGLWNEKQVEALRPIVREVQNTGAKMLVQLAHAGRKSEVTQPRPLSASAILHSSRYAKPVAMTLEDIAKFRTHMKEAAKRALEAGYDGIEIHAAHGYLINTFLSPATNQRVDEYGGSLENRQRLLKEILEDLRDFYPQDKVLGVRISAEDYVAGGMHVEEMRELLSSLTSFLDFVHVSSGGVTAEQNIQDFPLYQVGFAAALKKHLNIPIIAVGKISTVEEAEYILETKSADMVAFGRLLLRDPFFLARQNPSLAERYESYKRGFTE